MFQSSSKVPDDDVTCPFCVSDQAREFKRVGDLRHHVKTKHPAEKENAPRGLFSSKTCFSFPSITGRTQDIEERTSQLEGVLSKHSQRPNKHNATDSLFLLAIGIILASIKLFAESVSGVFQVLPETSSLIAARLLI
ncbi:hypothetical protein DPMN_071708 [Dreissena polymorpha]|uniref:Uncharacterized protein n=1 Tax=Dreissena polymorpha TaxID=45954 RepID=A0A9D3Z787_DREPO|nr:hypothetical protein DPMN_071708 [Dreissena polymorpha]